MGWLSSTQTTKADVSVKLWTCPDGEHWAVKIKSTLLSPNANDVARVSIAVSAVAGITTVGDSKTYTDYMAPVAMGVPLETDTFTLSAGQSVLVVSHSNAPVNFHLFGIKL